jgi:hypothetical protein
MARMLLLLGLVVLLSSATRAQSTNRSSPELLLEPAVCLERMQDRYQEVSRLQASLTNEPNALACVRAKLARIQGALDLAESGLRKLRVLQQATPEDEDRLDEERARIYLHFSRSERLALQAIDCLPPELRPDAIPANTPTAGLVTANAPLASGRRFPARPSSQCVSHGETARLLALAMELVIDAREESVACAELAQKGIEPPGGWQPAQCMTVDQFHIVAAKALGLKSEREDDPVSCARALRAAGLAVDSLLPPLGTDVPVPLLEQELRAFLAVGCATRPSR